MTTPEINDFYVDLYSNASLQEFSDNTCSSFRNRLATPLVLQETYEVALCDFIVPGKFESNIAGRIYVLADSTSPDGKRSFSGGTNGGEWYDQIGKLYTRTHSYFKPLFGVKKSAQKKNQSDNIYARQVWTHAITPKQDGNFTSGGNIIDSMNKIMIDKANFGGVLHAGINDSYKTSAKPIPKWSASLPLYLQSTARIGSSPSRW